MRDLQFSVHRLLIRADQAGCVVEETGIDALRVLAGSHAGRALAAAVAAAGGRLVSWRPCQVDHRLGRVTVGYQARVRWGRSRAPRTETLGATTGGSLPDGVTVVADGALRVGVWRVPFDPDLPGLPAAMDPAAMSGLLARFGLGGGAVRLRLRSYRPRRRAVVEATARSGRLFVKVIRPDRAQGLHERHRLIVASGVPAAQSLGWTDDGLLVLQALPGRTLREALHGSSGPWPEIGDLTSLVDRLPRELAVGRPRRGWADRAGDYAARVTATTPELGPRASAVAGAIATEAVPSPVVATHGDLYERQLLVNGARVTGLLDVDTAGPGDRLDDLACLIGHLSVLAQVWPQKAATIGELGGRYLSALERQVDPRQLRLRIAAVVLSLATGPHRVQEPGWPRRTAQRMELVERWLAWASTPDRSPAPRSPLRERGANARPQLAARP
jgi:Phosphotransferase enzyme family